MKNSKKEKFLRYSILGLSITMITLGAMRGETRTVLKKAINICLECIGIG